MRFLGIFAPVALRDSKPKRGLCEPSWADIVSMCSSVLCCLSPVIMEAATPWSESQLCPCVSCWAQPSWFPEERPGSSLSKKKNTSGEVSLFSWFFFPTTLANQILFSPWDARWVAVRSGGLYCCVIISCSRRSGGLNFEDDASASLLGQARRR